jgi:hypothetical protein
MHHKPPTLLHCNSHRPHAHALMRRKLRRPHNCRHLCVIPPPPLCRSTQMQRTHSRSCAPSARRPTCHRVFTFLDQAMATAAAATAASTASMVAILAIPCSRFRRQHPWTPWQSAPRLCRRRPPRRSCGGRTGGPLSASQLQMQTMQGESAAAAVCDARRCARRTRITTCLRRRRRLCCAPAGYSQTRRPTISRLLLMPRSLHLHQ